MLPKGVSTSLAPGKKSGGYGSLATWSFESFGSSVTNGDGMDLVCVRLAREGLKV